MSKSFEFTTSDGKRIDAQNPSIALELIMADHHEQTRAVQEKCYHAEQDEGMPSKANLPTVEELDAVLQANATTRTTINDCYDKVIADPNLRDTADFIGEFSEALTVLDEMTLACKRLKVEVTEAAAPQG